MVLDLSPQDRATLERAYRRLARQGRMRLSFSDLLAFGDRHPEVVREAEERFFNLMTSRDFLPNSPTLMNAGRELQQLSACFVLPIEDDLGKIFDSLKHAALIHQSGGGTGFSFSQLRPKNDIVRSTGGIASGPISFMTVYDAATNAVKQGGTRRGANMGILRVDHPDILEFISCKQDNKAITNFNISVALTERFMQALEVDGEYDLVNPRDGAVTGKLAAREVFDRIVQAAWRNGEPGIVFIDRIEEHNPTPRLGAIESTNPCVTGDTLLSTTTGLRSVRELWEQGREVGVVADSRRSPAERLPAGAVVATGVKPVFRLETAEGFTLRLTADHRVMTERGWVRAGELVGGDRIHVLDRPGGWGPAGSAAWGVRLGWQAGGGEELLTEVSLRAVATAQARASEPAPDRVPPVVLQGNRAMQRGFLRGLFSAAGAVVDGAVEACALGWVLARDVQRLLLNRGVFSVTQPDAVAGWGVRVSAPFLERFRREVGFLQPGKRRALDEACAARPGEPTAAEFLATFTALVPDGVEPVFDLTVPQVHAFAANGLVVHNCGEQPLLPYEACNLGSLNLAHLVREDASGAVVDWERLRQVVRESIHFLDNVIEANRLPLPEIEAMVMTTRKVGLGVMGWADLLIMLGIPYDTPKAVALAEEVMGAIDAAAKEASAQLADIRGPFPAWPGSVYDRPGDRPLRNATVTTIAPTGTISIIGGASSGIEPLFSIAFTRHVLDKQDLVEVNPLFEAVARRRGFYSEALVRRVAEQGHLDDLDQVPEDVRRLFVTAHDIDPEWHVRMQAAFQKHTDNAVSKTCNFPQRATPEDVARVYHLAYQLGCKGVTVYRDGSREEQVLTVGRREQTPLGPVAAFAPGWGKIHPIDRPDRLIGFTDRRETPLGRLFLTLNSLDGHPVELFAQIGKAGSDVAAFTEAIARLVSLALRCGVDPEEVASQLTGIGGSRSVGFGPGRILSVPDAMGHFMREVLEQLAELQFPQQLSLPLELTAAATSEVRPAASSYNLCPSCGMYTLVHEEGCAKCVSCGYSEC